MRVTTKHWSDPYQRNSIWLLPSPLITSLGRGQGRGGQGEGESLSASRLCFFPMCSRFEPIHFFPYPQCILLGCDLIKPIFKCKTLDTVTILSNSHERDAVYIGSKMAKGSSGIHLGKNIPQPCYSSICLASQLPENESQIPVIFFGADFPGSTFLCWQERGTDWELRKICIENLKVFFNLKISQRFVCCITSNCIKSKWKQNNKVMDSTTLSPVSIYSIIICTNIDRDSQS